VAKTPVSMRLDDDVVASLDAMADHRELTRTGMTERTIEVALRARQRACKATHQQGRRCGECGILVSPEPTTEDL